MDPYACFSLISCVFTDSNDGLQWFTMVMMVMGERGTEYIKCMVLKESNVSVVSYVMFYTMGMDPYACI